MIGLTVASQKGGVGKTTVALNLAYSLARRGWRTLLVDADPAGAVGLSLTKKVSQAPGLAEYASQIAGPERGANQPARGRDAGGLSQLIIDTRMDGLGILTAGRVPPEDATRFQELLTDGAVLSRIQTELRGSTDLVVYDTPSGFGGATLGAMRASAWVLCPVQAEPISARSVLRTLDVIGTLRGQGSPTQLVGILLTMLQTRDASSLGVAEDLWKSIPSHLLFDTSIPRDPTFLEASAAGVPVGLLRRRPPPVAIVFDQLAAELEARIHLQTEEGPDDPIALVD